jgi:predicted component of type VI protein secretion system
MQISVQLSWLEIATNQPQSLLLSLPIAIGKDATSLPQSIDGNQVEQMILSDRSVSRYHALLTFDQENVVVIDQNSTNGILVNGVLIDRNVQLCKVLSSGDRLTIGRYEITIAFDLSATSKTIITGSPSNSVKLASTVSTILFNPETGLPQANVTQPSLASSSNFNLARS